MSSPALRAAVIGANWGAVHVHAMREAGIDVVALVGRDPARTAAAAGGLGVRRSFTDLAELAGLGLDLIAVATPPTSHEAVIAALPSDVAVVCEKPAVGAQPPRGLLADRQGPVWVNFALPFLPEAQLLTHALQQAIIANAQVTSRYDLPQQLSASQWFFELAVHPWAWVAGLLGEPNSARAVAGQLGAIATDCGGVPTTVAAVAQPGLAGIDHEVLLHDAEGRRLAVLRGQYRVGGQWSFSAWLPTGPLPTSREPGDPWLRANVTAITAAAEVLRGRPADPRLTSWQVAVARDEVVQMALAGSGSDLGA